MLAGRPVWHIKDKIKVGIEGNRDLHVGDGEGLV